MVLVTPHTFGRRSLLHVSYLSTPCTSCKAPPNAQGLERQLKTRLEATEALIPSFPWSPGVVSFCSVPWT